MASGSLTAFLIQDRKGASFTRHLAFSPRLKNAPNIRVQSLARNVECNNRSCTAAIEKSLFSLYKARRCCGDVAAHREGVRTGLSPLTFILISAERTRSGKRLLIISFGKRRYRLQVKCSDPSQTLKGCGYLNVKKKKKRALHDVTG